MLALARVLVPQVVPSVDPAFWGQRFRYDDRMYSHYQGIKDLFSSIWNLH